MKKVAAAMYINVYVNIYWGAGGAPRFLSDNFLSKI